MKVFPASLTEVADVILLDRRDLAALIRGISITAGAVTIRVEVDPDDRTRGPPCERGDGESSDPPTTDDALGRG